MKRRSFAEPPHGSSTPIRIIRGCCSRAASPRFLIPVGDLQEIALHIEASLKSARDRYSARPAECEAVAHWLIQRCSDGGEGALTAVVIGLSKSDACAEYVARLHKEALSSDTAEPGVRVLAFVDALEGAVGELDRAIRELEEGAA